MSGFDLDIHERREAELFKYRTLQRLMPAYGSSNHGEEATKYIINKKPKFVVDFGCGRNNFINNLKTKGIEGKGVDFVYNEADIHAPMHDVPLGDNCADFITAFDSLEHLLPEDVELVFKEMSRIAMPKASFCFSISYVPSSIEVYGQNLHPTARPSEWWKKRIGIIGNATEMNKYLIGSFK